MKKKSYEENLKRIEEIIGLLEENKESLKESTLLFEEAMELISLCEVELNTTEERINKVIVKSEEKETILD